MYIVTIILADAVRPSSSPASSAAAGVLGGFGLFLIVLGWVIAIALAFTVYWAPSIVAIWKKHPHLVGIIVVNFLFGWTVLGWVASFIWSFIIPQPTQIIVQQVPAGSAILPPPIAPEIPKTTGTE